MTTSSLPETPDHAKRFTMWAVADQRLSRHDFEARLRDKAVRYVGIIHDRDPGVSTHLQGAFELKSKRTRTAAAKLLGVPATALKKVYATKTAGSKYAFAEATEYLLHPYEEQMRDKAAYEEREAFVSAGYDWVSDLDAMRLRRSQRRVNSRTPLTQLKLDISKMIQTEVDELVAEDLNGYFCDDPGRPLRFFSSTDRVLRPAFSGPAMSVDLFARKHPELWVHKGVEAERHLRREVTRAVDHFNRQRMMRNL